MAAMRRPALWRAHAVRRLSTADGSAPLASTAAAVPHFSQDDIDDGKELALALRDVAEPRSYLWPVFRLGCLPFRPASTHVFSALSTMRPVLSPALFERVSRFVTQDGAAPESFRAIGPLSGGPWIHADLFNVPVSAWDAREGEQPLSCRLDGDALCFLGAKETWVADPELALATRMAAWGALGGFGSPESEAQSLLALRLAFRDVVARLPAADADAHAVRRQLRLMLNVGQREAVHSVLADVASEGATLGELVDRLRDALDDDAVARKVVAKFVPNMEVISASSLGRADFVEAREGGQRRALPALAVSTDDDVSRTEAGGEPAWVRASVLLWGLPANTDAAAMAPVFERLGMAAPAKVDVVRDLRAEGDFARRFLSDPAAASRDGYDDGDSDNQGEGEAEGEEALAPAAHTRREDNMEATSRLVRSRACDVALELVARWDALPRAGAFKRSGTADSATSALSYNRLLTSLLSAEVDLRVATAALAVTQRGRHGEWAARMDRLLRLVREAEARVESLPSSSAAAAVRGVGEPVSSAPMEVEVGLSVAGDGDSALDPGPRSRGAHDDEESDDDSVGDAARPRRRRNRRAEELAASLAQVRAGPSIGMHVQCASRADALKLACESNRLFGIHVPYDVASGRVDARGRGDAIVDVDLAARHSDLIISGVERGTAAEALVDAAEASLKGLGAAARCVGDAECDGQVVLCFSDHPAAAAALGELRRDGFGGEKVVVDWYRKK